AGAETEQVDARHTEHAAQQLDVVGDVRGDERCQIDASLTQHIRAMTALRRELAEERRVVHREVRWHAPSTGATRRGLGATGAPLIEQDYVSGGAHVLEEAHLLKAGEVDR